ncbi:MAG: hypothetical protein ACUVXA_20360, partial [Candidatus Jordarchaeum sp.]|uniref:hypothetical protein n=1 Tax=Candidatus Jordarchaeum sp. TaxID=2823881 RepID=UPI00404A86FC
VPHSHIWYYLVLNLPTVVYPSKEFLEKAKLPDNGPCKVIVVGDEIIIRRQVSGELNLFKILSFGKERVPCFLKFRFPFEFLHLCDSKFRI